MRQPRRKAGLLLFSRGSCETSQRPAHRVPADTALDGGVFLDWSDELRDAIARADVALLLVSPDFLASDFIMQVELPALIAGGVRRVSTLLRDCRYQSVAQLMSVQWAHDPRPDGPITQLKARKVDGAIVGVTNALMAVVDAQTKRRAAPSQTGDQPRERAAQMPALAVAAGEGALDGMPAPPLSPDERSSASGQEKRLLSSRLRTRNLIAIQRSGAGQSRAVR